jgi:hypothetical protein
MAKKNCWEHKQCGREPGGNKTAELGICSAALIEAHHGIHEGKNGGRSCWVVAGTLCGGKAQGTFAMQIADCMECDFYLEVKKEEGPGFEMAKEILKKGSKYVS